MRVKRQELGASSGADCPVKWHLFVTEPASENSELGVSCDVNCPVKGHIFAPECISEQSDPGVSSGEDCPVKRQFFPIKRTANPLISALLKVRALGDLSIVV